MPPEETRHNVIVEVWSAVSVGVLLLVVVAGLVFFRLVPWWGALLLGLVGYVLAIVGLALIVVLDNVREIAGR